MKSSEFNKSLTKLSLLNKNSTPIARLMISITLLIMKMHKLTIIIEIAVELHIPFVAVSIQTRCEQWDKQHDDVIKWKHFPRNWPFVRGIHRSPHKGQWRGALMFSLICVWINHWVNNRKAGDLRRHRGHYDVIVMKALAVIRLCM